MSEHLSRPLTGYYFLTPVWGFSYVKLFVEVVIPAQLAAGNLGAFRGQPGCRYIIYTTRQDADTIRSSPVFDELNACIPVTFEWLDETVGNTHDKMSACFRSGIATADQAGAGILFLTPDIVFADGSFAAVKRLAESGRDAVFVPAIRTLKQGVVAALQSYGEGRAIRVAPRELMRVALDNLHPLADASWWDRGKTSLLPANIYWPVGNEGILGHCFHLHPIFVHPQRTDITFFGTVDDDFVAAACPDGSKDYVVSDSDEFLSIELSDLKHFFNTSFSKGSVVDAANWAEQFASDRHRTLFDHVIRMHTGMRDRDAWQKAEAEASCVVAAIKARLALPWKTLIATQSQALIRRIIRWNLDRRLVFENERDHTSGYWRYSFSFFLVDVYVFLIRNIRKYRRWYLGTLDSPRFYTINHLIRVLLEDDLRRMTRSCPDITLISDDQSESLVASILRSVHPKLTAAQPIRSGSECVLISLDLGQPIEPSSCGCIVVEPSRWEDVRNILAASNRALRPNARLLLLSGRVAFDGPDVDDAPYSRSRVEALLPPGMRLISHEQTGGSGSVGFYRFNVSLYEKLRVQPVFARILEFTLAIIWVPMFIIVNSLAALTGALRDRLDRKKASWMISLSLAEKAPEQVNRRPIPAERAN